MSFYIEMMDGFMNDQLKNIASEQKFAVLVNELRTPIEIIRGLAAVMKKDIESSKVEAKKLLNELSGIADAAEKIKELLEEAVGS
jgi:hypothetical protein